MSKSTKHSNGNFWHTKIHYIPYAKDTVDGWRGSICQNWHMKTWYVKLCLLFFLSFSLFSFSGSSSPYLFVPTILLSFSHCFLSLVLEGVFGSLRSPLVVVVRDLGSWRLRWWLPRILKGSWRHGWWLPEILSKRRFMWLWRRVRGGWRWLFFLIMPTACDVVNQDALWSLPAQGSRPASSRCHASDY